jgi:hypothetical protein
LGSFQGDKKSEHSALWHLLTSARDPAHSRQNVLNAACYKEGFQECQKSTYPGIFSWKARKASLTLGAFLCYPYSMINNITAA